MRQVIISVAIMASCSASLANIFFAIELHDSTQAWFAGWGIGTTVVLAHSLWSSK